LELTGIPTSSDLSEIHSPLALSVFDKLTNPEAIKPVAEHLNVLDPDDPTKYIAVPDDAVDLIE